MSNCLSLNTQDWMTDLSLRMCTHHERGVWLDVLCLMHKSEQVGVLNWPLTQIAQATGSDVATLSSLAQKGVLRGKSEDGTLQVHRRADLPLKFAATHARRKGEEVVLVELTPGDVWYCEWMVIGGHKRKNASAAALCSPGVTNRGQGKIQSGVPPADSHNPRDDHFELEGEQPAEVARKGQGSKVPDCPYEAIVKLFLARFPNAPKPRALNSTSRLGKAIHGMWRNQAKGKDEEFSGYVTTEHGLEKWARLFDLARSSKFLRGEATPRPGGEAFRISIDWFMTPRQVERVLNGFYDRPDTTRSIASEVNASAVRVADMVARKHSGGGTTPVHGGPAQGSMF